MTELGVFDHIATINPRSPSAAFGEPVSFVAMADVSEQGRLNSVEVRNGASGYTPFTENDVLVAKITPCLENGKGAHACHLPVPLGQGSTEFHVLRARLGTSSRYLYHLTRTDRFRLEAEALMTGSAGQRRVPAEFFRRYEIRVPPLEEQRRIAEVLDTIDETIQATERVIAKRHALRAGLTAHLLNAPTATTPSETLKPNETMPLPASTSTSSNLDMAEDGHRLSDYADLNSESLGTSTPGDLRFDYFDLSSVSNGSVIKSRVETLTFSAAPSRARRIARKDDFLFGTVRPLQKSHAWAPRDCIASTGFAVVRARKGLADSRFIAQVQGVVATLPCLRECRCSSRVSAGVFQPRVLRGRLFSAAATASRSPLECLLRSVPLGKYCRSRPLVFSLVPRCHGAWGSQK